MSLADVLVLEPDNKTRKALGQTLKGLSLRPIASGSFDAALKRVKAGGLEVVIADWEALVNLGHTKQSAPTLIAQLSTSIARLRSMHASRSARVAEESSHPLRIIITSDSENAEAHAASIQAGADAYLRTDEAREESVLGSYLARFLQQAREAPQPAGSARRTKDAVESSSGRSPSHVTEAFELQDEDLRDPESGRWDAKRIANVMAVPLKDLTKALSVNYSTVARTPDSQALQEKLAPFANVVAMTRQVYDQDDKRLRKWLRQPQAVLGDTAPLAALMQPGKASALEQWVSGVWLGESE